ncbi:hypothetical protein [Hymenobacter sp. BT491]|uniref:hypothetical protein n=1 Tax=Hymenobacter sp. BT491 TaxID=2766779 RepID=UPI001653BB74|nr:hypothetical protein [Hymenobacter sp. BT491]MBC6992239.1 hypothetical protein [Hymenobacter sp. BT491]
MSKPIEKIIKEYSPRGPLKQYRFEKSLSFNCFRCTQSKTSKLITIYYGDWHKRLCNGCYSTLISIYDIKVGQFSNEEKADKLSTLLLTLVDKHQIKEQENKIWLMQNQVKFLSKPSLKFFATAECVANTLDKEENLDWSPAVIGLCKAFELEMTEHFINPLKKFYKGNEIVDSDLKDKDYGRIAAYCAGKAINPPELGVINHFIKTVINSKDRIEKSLFLRHGLKDFLSKRPNSTWVTDKSGFSTAVDTLTKRFRNKAAHTDELTSDDYYSCKELIFGEKGIMWDLISSMQSR